MERLAAHHTVIAPDYPPVRTVNEYVIAFDGILRTESIHTFALGGQSYGGLLAQAYLAHRTADVDRLILSSTGPADYGRAWLPAEKAFIVLARILPIRRCAGTGAGLMRIAATVVAILLLACPITKANRNGAGKVAASPPMLLMAALIVFSAPRFGNG